MTVRPGRAPLTSSWCRKIRLGDNPETCHSEQKNSCKQNLHLEKKRKRIKTGDATLQIEGYRPECCISTMIYSKDTLFWSETLEIREKTGSQEQRQRHRDMLVWKTLVFPKTDRQGVQRRKEEEQMLKRSIFAILTGFIHSHLSYFTNHHENLSCFTQFYHRMAAQASSFPVNLWPWLNSKVSQTGIKLYGLVVLNIRAGLKQISPQVCGHMTMLSVYFTSVEFSPLNSTCAKQVVTTCWISSKSITTYLNLWENGHWLFFFFFFFFFGLSLIQLCPWMKIKVTQPNTKM